MPGESTSPGESSSDNMLERYIFDRIRDHGPIPFAHFMELALYHPTWGYYSTASTTLGKQGDYVTSPTLSPLFGALLAAQFRQMWVELDRPTPFVLLELGAGTGELARSILGTIAHRWPEWLEGLLYRIIERSETLITQQEQTLSGYRASVDWLSEADFREAENQFVGCVFSNEFFDALPVHWVEQRNRMLQEIYVAVENDQLAEMVGPPSDPGIATYLVSMGIELREGQRTTINLQALQWIERIGRALTQGFHLMVDYGYEAKDLHDPYHPDTLLCHSRHSTNTEFFERIGKQDITAHVDFTSLRRAGDRVGLKTVDFLPQWKFLLDLGWMEEYQQFLERRGEAAPALPEAHGMKQLIWPGGMGDIFKVLIQRKA